MCLKLQAAITPHTVKAHSMYAGSVREHLLQIVHHLLPLFRTSFPKACTRI